MKKTRGWYRRMKEVRENGIKQKKKGVKLKNTMKVHKKERYVDERRD